MEIEVKAGGESPPDLLADGAMGLPDAAAFTGLKRTDLYDRMKRGELAYTKCGKRRLIPKRALVALLAKGLVPAATEEA